MSKLPTIRRIVKEDISNPPVWIDQLINPLNTFMEQVYNALDRDLSIGENVRGTFRTISFTTRSDYLTASPLLDGWEIQKVQDPIGTKPTIVAIGQTTDVDSYKTITSPVGISWDYLNGVVRINYISGLLASKKYEVKLLIL